MIKRNRFRNLNTHKGNILKNIVNDKDKIYIKYILFNFEKCTYHILYKLWPMSAHSFDSLENVNLPVLNDMFYTGIGSTIDSATAPAVGRYHSHRSIVRSLPPSLNHIHELH